MRIFIALIIYISIVGTSNIASFWDKCRHTVHKLMAFMTYYWYQQIMRYFHISLLNLKLQLKPILLLLSI
jgi:hypothetical protein